MHVLHKAFHCMTRDAQDYNRKCSELRLHSTGSLWITQIDTYQRYATSFCKVCIPVRLNDIASAERRKEA
jgi:hypothetical protein